MGPPVKQRSSSNSICSLVRRYEEEMLATGVIEESNSPWASPVVLVNKPDGSLRFGVDYRKLNAVTRKDVFPLPLIDDLLDQLSGRKIFSTLDAHTSYVLANSGPEFIPQEGCICDYGWTV